MKRFLESFDALRWTRRAAALSGALSLALASAASAAGLLTPVGGGSPLQLRDHHVAVVIDGGYARTTWTQTFFNPGAQDLEAVYEVPLPEESTLAEVSLLQGDRVLRGEVVARAEGERIYGAEKAAGEDAGLATQDGYRRYRFEIARVPAQAATVLEVTYYQPVLVEAGVGTYRYPLEEGGTDDGAGAFWSHQDRLTGTFAIDLEVRAGAPLAQLRAPGFESATTTVVDEATRRLQWQGALDRLNRDFVLYYQLEEDLPGRVEVYAHKPSATAPGTFLAVITPGLDLKPLEGSDFVFILDLSGSMESKFGTLVQGVRESIRTLSAADRFRIVLFNENAQEWTNGWVAATPANVAQVLASLHQLKPGGGTNLHAGMELGLARLETDRACSCILVTDGVTNRGVTDPEAFRQTLARCDVRLFCFLLGNSANVPLIDVMCEASGGYSRVISNEQDIIGEILLAQSKVAYQSLHDAQFTFSGGALPYDVTGQRPRKIFRGQQILVMGRYREAGELQIALDARLTGEDRHYATALELPAVEPSRPELERLWALRQLREWNDPAAVPALAAEELQAARLGLALEYQLVTDDTAMLLLSDETFARYGIDRRNAARAEREAQARRSAPAPAQTDANRPLTSGRAPSFGGGALDVGWLLVAALLGAGWLYLRRGR